VTAPGPVGDAIYELRDVRQVYDGRQVLDIPSLHIRRGEIFVLVGPSGAGKSTLLRLLGLVESPDMGQVTLHLDDGRAVAHGSANIADRRRLAMVFQRPVLLSRTVQANVAFGLRLRGQRANADEVMDVLQRVSMSHLAGARPDTLSGGEMQRVAVARALILAPRVLLLDEPTANLDPYNVRLLEDLIREQNDAFGTTIVLVTHNVFQAKRMASRVGLLLEGDLVEVGARERFFTAPEDPRTEAFLSGELVY
jgi:tungstate transport system ATP-binding protein